MKNNNKHTDNVDKGHMQDVQSNGSPGTSFKTTAVNSINLAKIKLFSVMYISNKCQCKNSSYYLWLKY